MKTTLAVLLASSLAFADPPLDSVTADAPLADLPGRSVKLLPGQSAPFACRCLSDAEHVASERVAADDHAFRKKTDGKLMLSPIALVAIVAGSAAASAAITAGVVVAVKK